MKTILLLRHAKSDWSNPALADFDRPLAKRGLKDAPRMGQVLAYFNCIPDIILSSPAKRAKQTTELVAEACGFSRSLKLEDSFYGGGADDMLAALQQLPHTVNRPLLVGHNPAMEETVQLLLSGDTVDWDTGCAIRLPTAGLVCLEADIIDWADLEPGETVLRWFLIPKLVKAIR